MTASTTQDRVDALVRKVFGDPPTLDTRNWTQQGKCQPWLFDMDVFNAAHQVRIEMSDEDLDALRETPDHPAYYRTLEALRGLPWGRDFATARLIVAMFLDMETWGLVD